YSPAFVEQFKIFHEELREFFNARSLDEQLRALLPGCDKEQTALIEAILNRKADAGTEEQLALFGSLTDLRLSFSICSGRREEAVTSVPVPEPPHVGCYDSHDVLVADVALEDF